MAKTLNLQVPKVTEYPRLEQWCREVTEYLNDLIKYEFFEVTSSQASGSEIVVDHDLGEIPDHVYIDVDNQTGAYATEAQRRRWTKDRVFLTATIASPTIRGMLWVE
jgi:hypothetical protein